MARHRRSRAPLALLALLLSTSIVACGDDKPKEAAATGSAAAPGAPATGTGATAPAAAPPAAMTGRAYVRGELLDHLPKECPAGRAYVDVQKLLGGDGGTVGKLIEKLVLDDEKDRDKVIKVLTALREGGLDPSAVREIAACVTVAGSPIVAFGVDTAKAKDPLGAITRAIEAGEGEGKVTVLEEGDQKYLKNPRGEVVGFVSPTVIVLAKTLDRLKEAAKTPGGGSAFEDASSHVLWLHMTSTQKARVGVREDGSDYLFNAKFAPDQGAEELTKNPDVMVAALAQEAKRRAARLSTVPKLAALGEAVQKATFGAEDGQITISTKLPQAALVDAIKVFTEMSADDLGKLMQ